ncbi:MULTISPECIES: serine hydrolase [Mycolicibacterium]|uniref:serine hydrolase n=1 Tax=Mycolicibacterium TaxID=1866885 RepID=UPI0018E3439E|nr:MULTISPECIES: serine hydrolase [Mycolicibacterium]MCV7290212.1 class A beta-lactamase-related serine hydrolase [Mycolicibacterium wolinskyi]MCV7292924.1 class A beta-lactamase-related serine hydrolase [Mycolicibacterium goodii]
MRGPAPRRSRGRALRRAAGLATIVAVAATLACGCSHSVAPAAEVSYGAHIDTKTPPGLRAKQTMDMLNSDWPIGPIGVRTLAAPEAVDEVGTKMDSIWWDRPFRVTSVDIGAGQATLHVLTSYNVAQDIELRTDDLGMVDRFEVNTVHPTIDKWSDIDEEIAKTGAKYSYQVSKVTDGKCETVAGTNTDLSLPLASIFKLYVLLAVSDAIKANTLSWDDKLTITKDGKALGSAGLDKLPPGAQITVRTAAQQMISASDNMATDLLIARMGTGAVERALVTAGHHDPASMTPFPTMHEVFSVGWGEPNLREQWKNASPEDRVRLFKQTNSRPYQPDPNRTHTPASNDGLEWFGSAADICRVHAALQKSAVGEAAPVKQILSALPGIDLDPAKWHYIGAKGGNLPGDLTFSWYAVDHTGQPWVVSFQLNWPQFRSPTAAGWLLSIAKRAFALAPVG